MLLFTLTKFADIVVVGSETEGKSYFCLSLQIVSIECNEYSEIEDAIIIAAPPEVWLVQLTAYSYNVIVIICFTQLEH